MSQYDEDKLLDCSGLCCPLPILKTKKSIDSLESGQVLKMISTDPGAINDMNAWARQTKHELLESIAENGEYTFLIRKS